MGRHQRVISEALYKKAQLAISNIRNIHSREYTRLKILISAKEKGITVVGSIVGVSPNNIRKWAKRFKAEGIEGLKYKIGRGRKSNIPKSKYDILKEWISKDHSMTIKEMVYRMQEEFSIKTSISALHRILVKLGLAYITPRPVHYKQNKRSQNEFKKKSAASISI